MLELKNISFRAEDSEVKKEILSNISIEIEERFVAITGPNGGGKSTLAKLIMGIEKPTSGQIISDGVDITNMSIFFSSILLIILKKALFIRIELADQNVNNYK